MSKQLEVTINLKKTPINCAICGKEVLIADSRLIKIGPLEVHVCKKCAEEMEGTNNG